MGRKTQSKALNVWMNGHLVGQWSISSAGIHEFHYFDSWLNSDFSRPISLSLPLAPSQYKHKGPVVESYFDNLLPDSFVIRKRIQSRFGKKTIQAFDLLEEIVKADFGIMPYRSATQSGF
jgi:serine/threonine-protein kinase HipA